MPAVIVLTCSEGGSQAAVPLTTNSEPRCPTGNGSWQAITVSEEFDIADMTGEELMEAWGAGFTVMATGLVIVLACRALLRAIR